MEQAGRGKVQIKQIKNGRMVEGVIKYDDTELHTIIHSVLAVMKYCSNRIE